MLSSVVHGNGSGDDVGNYVASHVACTISELAKDCDGKHTVLVLSELFQAHMSYGHAARSFWAFLLTPQRCVHSTRPPYKGHLK